MINVPNGFKPEMFYGLCVHLTIPCLYSLVLAMKMTHTFWDCATIVYGCSAVCCSVCKCKAIMWHDQVLNNNHNKISASKTQSKFRWIFWLFVLELITLEWSYEPEMRANSICLCVLRLGYVMHCNSCTESKYFNDVRHSIESADLNALVRILLLTIESLTSTENCRCACDSIYDLR